MCVYMWLSSVYYHLRNILLLLAFRIRLLLCRGLPPPTVCKEQEEMDLSQHSRAQYMAYAHAYEHTV